MPQSWESEQCACERAWQSQRESMRLWESVIHLSAQASTRKHLLVIFTHMLAPSSAAWRHFRNSALLLWPSLLQWLHGKQTFARRKPPVHFPKGEKKNKVGLTSGPISMALPCFVSHSTFNLTRRHLSDHVPEFHCNQKGSYYLKCSAHQFVSISWLTIGCNHLTQNSSEWVRGSVSAVIWQKQNKN